MSTDGTSTPPTEGAPAGENETPPATDDVTVWKERASLWEKRSKENFAKAKANEEAAARLAELEKAQMSELDAARATATEWEQKAKAATERANEALIRSAVVSASTRAGAIDPDVVFALIDRNGVTVTDTGQVEGVDAAVAAILTSRPYLLTPKGGTPPAPGAADGGPQGSSAPLITEAELKTLPPEKVAELYRAGALAHLINKT